MKQQTKNIIELGAATLVAGMIGFVMGHLITVAILTIPLGQ